MTILNKSALGVDGRRHNNVVRLLVRRQHELEWRPLQQTLVAVAIDKQEAAAGAHAREAELAADTRENCDPTQSCLARVT